jgi:hypothetical protein
VQWCSHGNCQHDDHAEAELYRWPCAGRYWHWLTASAELGPQNCARATATPCTRSRLCDDRREMRPSLLAPARRASRARAVHGHPPPARGRGLSYNIKMYVIISFFFKLISCLLPLPLHCILEAASSQGEQFLSQRLYPFRYLRASWPS